ncbi:GNAT family N-acetyltransferase [Streptomyces spinoverrucosus]|nr:GNAT family N-acetyltransferase [Streptomyces spinoverrucosus]
MLVPQVDQQGVQHGARRSRQIQAGEPEAERDAEEPGVPRRRSPELAVRADARGAGLAGKLLEAVTADAPEGRSWLLTSVQSPRAMSFYRHQGWTPATPPVPWPPNPCNHGPNLGR